MCVNTRAKTLLGWFFAKPIWPVHQFAAWVSHIQLQMFIFLLILFISISFDMICVREWQRTNNSNIYSIMCTYFIFFFFARTRFTRTLPRCVRAFLSQFNTYLIHTVVVVFVSIGLLLLFRLLSPFLWLLCFFFLSTLYSHIYISFCFLTCTLNVFLLLLMVI